MFKDFETQFRGFTESIISTDKLYDTIKPLSEVVTKDRFFMDYIRGMVKECQRKLMKEYLLHPDRDPVDVVGSYFILIFQIGMMIGASSREKELKHENL